MIERAGPVPAGLGRLLRLLPEATGLPSLDGWIRRRLRCVAWKQWKTRGSAIESSPAGSPRTVGQCGRLQPQGTVADEPPRALNHAFTNARFRRLGLLTMEKLVECLIRRTAVYGPVCTVVWEGRDREVPPYPD